jgi:diguanylate cyclase (GGDEF)-like protein
MKTSRFSTLSLYVSAVIATGAGTTALIALTVRRPHLVPSDISLIGFLVLFLVIGELFPIEIRSGASIEPYTFSGTAAIGLLITGPLFVVTAAQMVACLVDDVRAKRSPTKVAFNLALLPISLLAGRVVYSLLTHKSLFGYSFAFPARCLGPALLAAAVYFMVHVCLMAVVLALAEGESPVDFLLSGIRSKMPIAIVLLSTGPMILVALRFSLFTAPLCLLPALAVRSGALQASRRELQAMHDSLTGLANRSLLFDGIENALRTRRRDELLALIFIDLDEFKQINDAVGHGVGDELLRQTATRLSLAVRQNDLAARLGGDEFAVLCTAVPDETTALELAGRAVDALTGSVTVSGITLRVQASAGIALCPIHATDAESLLQRADVALYKAKETGKGAVLLYEEEEDHNSIEQLTLMAELHESLESQLVVHYQPKCRLSDGKVVGAEALVRWQHPMLGLVPPAKFLPAAENVGLSLRLTVHVVRSALRQLYLWKEQGLDISVSVNVSAPSMVNPTLARKVAELFSSAGSPVEGLILEMTESSMLTDFSKASEIVGHLRDLGIEISIDDFGTGYSSLEYIRELAPSEVKIDRSFVAASAASERDMALIHAAVKLGKNLGISVVAEGAENADQLRAAAEAGCDLVQGFFILPPVPAEELTEWMRRPQVWQRHLPASALESAGSQQ